ncbi:response regulator [Vulgatibacter sp.]|uniref:hybrid sensor histidine kinase/response regulator n=1 Tax=Vulgatibacter sp. TaxID=1971226 RepID=UPI0035662C62
MGIDELQRRLLATFAEELAEQGAALERELLAIERDPGAPVAEPVRAMLRIAHALKGAARAVALAPVEQLCHKAEALLGAVRDGEAPLDGRRLELLLELADRLQGTAAALRAGEPVDEAALGALAAALEQPGAAAPAAAAPSRAEAPPPLPPAEEPGGAPRGGSLRVSTQEIDDLVAWSGELLVSRGRIERRAAQLSPLRAVAQRSHVAQRRLAALRPAAADRGRWREMLDELALPVEELAHGLERLERAMTEDARELSRVARAVETRVREVRMVPFAQATEGLERATRDLARSEGKEVRLELRGGTVRLDRAVAEGLRDPLLQLLRNAIDHGIEPPDEREAAGKERHGTLRVAAELRGDQVAVRVEDDGRGVDLDAIRRAAERAGLEAPASPSEAAQLLFRPGFSTRSTADAISGRGVGLDVVRGGIEALRGSVSLGWRPGGGSRFLLTVPLTLGTSRVLLVRAGGERLAVPGGAVERVARIARDSIHTLEGREVVEIGGCPVALASLAGTLGLPEREREVPEASFPVVVIGTRERRAAYAVEHLDGETEVLVKTLGRRLRRVAFVSGAALLPEGALALIVQPSDLVDATLGGRPGRRLAEIFAPPPAERRRRVLLADDSLTTRSLERSILESAGYEVLAAVDGAEAWQLLQEQGADLIVADVEMPRMDGFTLTETVRSSRRFRDLPVVLVTSLDTEADRARGLQAGANAYIVKSAFDQKGLLDTVAQLL